MDSKHSRNREWVRIGLAENNGQEAGRLYIADGEMTFRFEDREVVARTGTFVFVPLGAVHTARDTGGRPMRGLLILSPGDAAYVSPAVERGTSG